MGNKIQLGSRLCKQKLVNLGSLLKFVILMIHCLHILIEEITYNNIYRSNRGFNNLYYHRRLNFHKDKQKPCS